MRILYWGKSAKGSGRAALKTLQDARRPDVARLRAPQPVRSSHRLGSPAIGSEA